MSQISKSDCVEILSSKLGHTNFQLEDFQLKSFDELLGFHACHASLTIQGIIDDVITDFKFFVKSGSESPLLNERYWKVLRQFYKEHVFMSKLVKTLQNFVQPKLTSECYLSRLDGFMVLEDLCLSGYETARSPVCDMKHVERAVQAFANLHASSLLYEEKTGVMIDEKYKDIIYESLLFEDDKHPTELLLYSVDEGVRAVAEKFLTHLNEEQRDALFTKIRRRVVETQNHPKKFRKVVCQGDPWGNNILYKYDNSGAPTEAILIDFGCMRFGPPAMDVMQFLYLGTPTDFRIRYKAQVKDLYYKHLSSILADNGLEVSTILPRSEFLESCDVYEEFGLCCRVYYQYVTRLPGPYLQRAAASEDMFLGLMTRGDPELGIEAFEEDEVYRKDLTEAIEDAQRYYQ